MTDEEEEGVKEEVEDVVVLAEVLDVECGKASLIELKVVAEKGAEVKVGAEVEIDVVAAVAKDILFGRSLVVTNLA